MAYVQYRFPITTCVNVDKQGTYPFSASFPSSLKWGDERGNSAYLGGRLRGFSELIQVKRGEQYLAPSKGLRSAGCYYLGSLFSDNCPPVGFSSPTCKMEGLKQETKVPSSSDILGLYYNPLTVCLCWQFLFSVYFLSQSLALGF